MESSHEPALAGVGLSHCIGRLLLSPERQILRLRRKPHLWAWRSELYHYGSRGHTPYEWTFQPTVFLTSKGRRDFVASVPEQSGTTLYAEEQGVGQRGFWSNFVWAGLVWDTRDRETGTRSGIWTELLGVGAGLARWAFTDRIVFAHRLLLQGNTEDARVHELFRIQTSFKQQEGLGGSKMVRGVLKNRLVRRGMLVWNAELR
jgi:hypothetical protein